MHEVVGESGLAKRRKGATISRRNCGGVLAYGPVGALFDVGKPRTAFFDPNSPEARDCRSLEAAFGGPVRITSRTADGRIALVQVWSDRNPGDFYLFDSQTKTAEHLLSRREWFDPEQMATHAMACRCTAISPCPRIPPTSPCQWW